MKTSVPDGISQLIEDVIAMRSAYFNLVAIQQLVADMIGVRREGVALAAKRLQVKGWISYRGLIVILNRAALESNACECYQTINQEYRRLLGWRKPEAKPSRAPLAVT